MKQVKSLIFAFKKGPKRLGDCTKEELYEVLSYCNDQLLRSDKELHRRTEALLGRKELKDHADEIESQWCK